MFDPVMIIIAVISAVAAIFAFLAFRRSGNNNKQSLEESPQFIEMLRNELARTNQVIEANARGLRIELGTRVDASVKLIDEKVLGIATKLDQDISTMGKEANAGREILRDVIAQKLDDASTKQVATAKEAREEITASFKRLGGDVQETLDRATEEQKARLDDVTKALGLLTDKQEKAQVALKETVERRLDSIRTANEAKLEEMRLTVDEKLQSTLEKRLGESFKLVTDQLIKVSAGLGEMQQLATGVGDLKRVLTQVKSRGIWGEVQLESLLEDFLAPDQFARNVTVRPDSPEHVEFAIRLPKLSDGSGEVYLPIDAKFAHEDFQRLVAAAELADSLSVEEAAKGLERALKSQAKDISQKYIAPPFTTEYAILFLPSEALYAEVARRPGLVEALTHDFSVMIAGPSTLVALLNAIRVGFRSALIHRQAGEISKLLQRVRTEFDKYGTAVQTAAKRAASTVDAIAKLQTRQNVMGRALKGVDLLSADTPIDAANQLLDFEIREEEPGGAEKEMPD
jgi:DNA recombination protein RmuC